jgi:hypothetical protein
MNPVYLSSQRASTSGMHEGEPVPSPERRIKDIGLNRFAVIL